MHVKKVENEHGKEDAVQVEVELTCEIIDVVKSNEYLSSCINEEGSLIGVVKIKVGVGLKFFGAMKRKSFVKDLVLGVKVELT